MQNLASSARRSTGLDRGLSPDARTRPSRSLARHRSVPCRQSVYSVRGAAIWSHGCGDLPGGIWHPPKAASALLGTEHQYNDEASAVLRGDVHPRRSADPDPDPDPDRPSPRLPLSALVLDAWRRSPWVAHPRHLRRLPPRTDSTLTFPLALFSDHHSPQRAPPPQLHRRLRLPSRKR